MKKVVFVAAAAALCLLTACGGETAEEESAAESAAESTAGTQTGKLRTLPETTVMTTPPPGEVIDSLSFTYSAPDVLTLDIDEKLGSFAAHVESDDFVTKDMFEIYAEDASLVEISDVELKDGGLVNFYLTGKKAGESKLYIATADGVLVSAPLEFRVRSTEEQAHDNQTVYYTILGEHWHLSEDCAKEDYPSVGYDYQGNSHEIDKSSLRLMTTTLNQMTGVGDRTACPKCAAEEAAQQDGE